MAARNEPCPCGSGKKYKHCCLKKDEAARRAAHEEAKRLAREPKAAPPSFPVPTPARLPLEAGKDEDLWDELEQEANAGDSSWDEPEMRPDADADLALFEARWEEFEAAENYEEQIAIFLATLDDGLMDDENAFEMLNAIYEATAASGERERFDPLVALLRQRLPDVYAHEAHFCLDWLISNALAAGRLDALPALADELAGMAGEHLDTVIRVFDQLAYHGQLAVLAAAMRRAWPLVRDSNNIFQWAIVDFAERGTRVAILDYLQGAEAPNAVELDTLGAYFGCSSVQPDGAVQFLAHVSGQTGRRWTLDDFNLAGPEQRKRSAEAVAGEGRTNLSYLTVEFLGYLRREEGMSYAKGELARDQLERYILERYAEELQKASGRSKARKTKAKALASGPVHPLCPDRATLDRYLANLLHLFNMRLHKAAALFEMIPAWLRFLEGCELIDSSQRQRALSELISLNADLIGLWRGYNADPALWLAAKRWQEDAGLAG
jgi:hypothetical protein